MTSCEIDDKALINALEKLAEETFADVKRKQLKDMRNRAVNERNTSQGGTPVQSGELRQSASISSDEFGYTKDYAPHVEYGHRTRGGGYVPGQKFLKANAEIQQKEFEKDILNKIKSLI